MRLMGLMAGIALAAGPVAAAHAGTLYYSEDNNSNGLYTLSTVDGSATFVGTTTVTSNTVGLAPHASPSRLWGSKPFGLLEIEADGSGATTLGGEGYEGLAFDPVAGTLYYAINGVFGTVNTATGGSASTLARPGSDVEGLAWGNGGVYGLDTGSILKFYDPGAGTWTTIGSTGIATGFNKGLAFDNETGDLYMISGQDSFLYRYDLGSNTTSTIGDTGRQTARGGLAFVGGPVVPLPPAAWMGLGLMGGLALLRRRRRQS